MLKSLWFLIYPIVELAYGEQSSESAFCTVSGFFLTLGIEACDVAVLLIAIHTALYIFVGGGGLYPYRRFAYAAFCLLPLLLASLAFLNKPAYINTGEFCYLAIEPDWTRRALSWIPRYVIFVTLLVLYTCIYIYVKVLMTRFGTTASGGVETSTTPSRPFGTSRRRFGLTSQLPRITYHGLLPSTGSSRSVGVKCQNSPFRRSPGPPTMGAASMPSGPKWPLAIVRRASGRKSHQKTHGISWRLPHFGQDAALSATEAESLSPGGTVRSTAPHTIKSERVLSGSATDTPGSGHAPLQSNSDTSGHPDRERLHIWHRSDSEAARVASQGQSLQGQSLIHLATALRRGPRSPGSRSRSTSTVVFSPRRLDWAGNRKSRDSVRRQLRYLFVYPVVYLCVWIVPFLAHTMGADSNGASFGLVMVSLISLCIQGFADALVFTIKEKPWLNSKQRTRRCSFWSPWSWRRRSSFDFDVGGPAVGRSREQMTMDGFLARKRRDVESAHRDEERRQTLALPSSARREWWDQFIPRSDEASDDEVAHGL